MSVSYHASMVAGVRINLILTEKITETLIKKYHPDTGEPYLEPKKKTTYFWLGKEIEEPFEENPEHWAYLESMEDRVKGLGVHQTGYSGRLDYSQWVLGISLAGINRPNIVGVGEEQISAARHKVSEKLQIDYSAVKVFLVFYAG